ncbi:hypothetical protein IPA_01195 [Ignicoccus pacificus DSM 13166]|uniref:Uncharacterized protein n=1 Tax=Ignicoccus pacificus DSM 13166 TaxID=940294 RepID=A0A977PKJ6_9CREN|nr:hypothetical protein IPA_01195 [Ignicoccus pacificus DSM 13166]
MRRDVILLLLLPVTHAYLLSISPITATISWTIYTVGAEGTFAYAYKATCYPYGLKADVGTSVLDIGSIAFFGDRYSPILQLTASADVKTLNNVMEKVWCDDATLKIYYVTTTVTILNYTGVLEAIVTSYVTATYLLPKLTTTQIGAGAYIPTVVYVTTTVTKPIIKTITTTLTQSNITTTLTGTALYSNTTFSYLLPAVSATKIILKQIPTTIILLDNVALLGIKVLVSNPLTTTSVALTTTSTTTVPVPLLLSLAYVAFLRKRKRG